MTAENLVLITVDALRHDALGCAGSSYASTPNLDDLANEGVRFEQAISNGPRTQASFPSIMGSLYPLVAGERRGLPLETTTLAEAASGAGLTTAGFNPSNPFLTRETGYDRGFDLFIDFWDVHDRTGSGGKTGALATMKKNIHDSIGRRSLGFLMLLQALLLEEGGQNLTGRFLTDRATAWLQAQDGPFFMWLHFMDVHFPYQPLPGRRTFRDRLSFLNGMAGLTAGNPSPAVNALKRLYGDRVDLVDGYIGELVDSLKDLGLKERTTIVVTSDHGEQLGEHGRWAHGPDLHEELIRVPLILNGPGLAGPRRIERQVELLGLAPTLLDLLGISAPPSFLGSSFAPLALAHSGNGSDIIFSETMHCGSRLSRSGISDTFTVSSCREAGWKFIHDTEDNSEELYDLDTDPDERTNVALQHPDRTAHFRHLIDQHRRDTASLASAYECDGKRSSTPDDAEMRRRLAALGYL
ncbi:MAG: sulfatase [Acidobacteriota bacterium]